MKEKKTVNAVAFSEKRQDSGGRFRCFGLELYAVPGFARIPRILPDSKVWCPRIAKKGSPAEEAPDIRN